MADWTLVPCLVGLRGEFNLLAPNRDHASDGSIGDAAHAAGQSDHNPDSRGLVHAIDVDADLRRAGWSMERAVQLIVVRHRTGQDTRLQNVIYQGRIWSRSWGWVSRAYGGVNPHDKHAHFSARYAVTAEDDVRPWGLLAAQADDDEELGVAFADEKIKITATTGAELFEPDLTAGTEVDAATVLQLAAIWAKRAALSTDTLEATVKTLADGQAILDRRLSVLEDWFARLNTSQASPEQTAALLRVALGEQAGPVGRLLAGI